MRWRTANNRKYKYLNRKRSRRKPLTMQQVMLVMDYNSGSIARGLRPDYRHQFLRDIDYMRQRMLDGIGIKEGMLREHITHRTNW